MFKIDLPRVFRSVVAFLAGEEEEYILGDLDYGYNKERQRSGQLKASLWLGWQYFTSIGSLFLSHIRSTISTGPYQHVFVSCALYGLLQALAPIIETSYRFDLYRRTTLRLAVFTFLWMFVTSIVALLAGWSLQSNGRQKSMIIVPLSFFVASLPLFIASDWLLPSVPIIEATVQTHTAQGAYLKSILFQLPLAIIYLVLPFIYLASTKRTIQEKPGDTITSRMRRETLVKKAIGLGLIVFAVQIVLILMTGHLFDNLKAGASTNFFMQLVLWRLVVCGALGIECALWFYLSVRELKLQPNPL